MVKSGARIMAPLKSQGSAFWSLVRLVRDLQGVYLLEDLEWSQMADTDRH